MRALLRPVMSAGQWFVALAVVGCVLYAVTTVVLVPGLQGARDALGGQRLLVLIATGLAGPTLWGLGRLGPGWASLRDLAWRQVGALVGRRELGAFVCVAVLACVIAAMLGYASHVSGHAAGPLVATSTISMISAAALSWLGQHLDQPEVLGVLALVCLAVAAALLCAPAGPLALWALAASALAASTLPAMAAPGQLARRWARAWRLTSPPPRWSLSRSGAFVEAVVATATTTDAATLELLRSSQATAPRRPARPWLPALVLLRSMTSTRVAAALPLLALPAGAGAVWGPVAAVAAVMLVTSVFTARAATSLDSWIERPSMHRTYASARWRTPALLVASPLALSITAAAGAVALASVSPLWAVAASCFAVLAVLRRITGRRMIGRAGPLVATPAGPVPTGVVIRLIAGPDVALIALVTVSAGATSSTIVGAVLLVLAAAALIIWQKTQHLRAT